MTDGLGNYAIHSIPNGTSGSIDPTLADYTFSRVDVLFTYLPSDLTAVDFTATQISPIFSSIAGSVTLSGAGLPGVLNTFGMFTATTAANGTYRISSIPAGTKGRIIPSLAGYVFTLNDITVSNLSSNQVNQNFTATPVYTISGKVTDVATLHPVGGVTVTFASYSAVSNSATGAYTIRNIPAGTSGVVIPSLAGETFTPSGIPVTNLQADMHGQNFVATP